MTPDPTRELFPDAAAIVRSLERHTRAALIRRHGDPNRPNEATAARPAGTSPAIEVTADGQAALAFDAAPDAAVDAARRRAKGIGFSLDLVRSLFDGRKTQTRRLVRPLPTSPPRAEDCPLGRPGDWLYVREPYLPLARADVPIRYAYAADATPGDRRRFRPAMSMPRDAARLWLHVAFVRAERLKAIAPADLDAEGLPLGRTLPRVWDTFYTAPGERWADNPWVWVLGFVVRGA